MLIVIPTYRRIACLKWTLLSLFQAQQTHQLPSVKLCIVNNHPQSRVLLEQLISEIRGGNSTSSSIEWHVIHREKTLDPVINWYSAIEELAEPDEVVLLHGDDDLFMPWGVFARVQAINASNADMLMTRSAHGLLYLPDSQSCTLRNLDVTRGGELCKVERKDIDGWGPAFIGNHCYKNTPTFRKAVKLSFDWCHDQCWLDQNTRTLMLPYYLPFAIKEVGGNLYGLNETCVLRGGGLEEILTAKYGVSGWNPGFLFGARALLYQSSDQSRVLRFL